jgi:hypothetical protein
MERTRHSGRDRGGFSLVELIACLLLMGVIGGIWGLGMVQVVEGFLHSRQNAAVFMKGQAGLARMTKELRMAAEIATNPPPGADSLTFLRGDDGRETWIRLDHDPAAGTVELNGEVLVDEVRRFYIAYAADYRDFGPSGGGLAAPVVSPTVVPQIRLVALHLDLNGPQDTVVRFETRLFLRGLS